MSIPHYDLIVIGCGPAGEKGAAKAAYFGKKVAIIERAEYVGGAGINTGTVPSKTLRESALYFSGLLKRGLYGLDYSLKSNLTVAELMHRERTVVENEHQIIHRNIERHEIDLIWGEGRLKDSNTVQVHTRDGESIDLHADVILIATGSSPHSPPDVPFDGQLIFDSDTILSMSFIPQRMVIVGGGVIGSEYASMFSALGAQVTLIDGRDRLLPFVDQEIVQYLANYLERLGLRFLFNTRVMKTEKRGKKVHLQLDSGEELEADCALFAAGRQSNVAGLGLEEVGVELGRRGVIMVNENYQTRIPNIYAAGDVVGFPALASTSMEQARVAIVHAFDLHYKEAVSSVLPLAVYTVPEIAMVGLSEGDCQEKDIPYLVGRAETMNNARGQIIGEVGMLKLIFAREDKKLLGVHIVSEMAAELVHIGMLVLASGGTIDAFIQATFNYPTLSDMYKYAAYDGLGQWERWQESQ